MRFTSTIRSFALASLACLALSTDAQESPTLDYKTGEVQLDGGIATVRLPPSLRFLDAQGSRVLLTEVWGNPPGSADGVLGMLVPANLDPTTPEGWAVVVTFEETGFVDDSDAASIDYDQLLESMKAGSAEANAQRVEQGFGTVDVVGWADTPSYDASAHKLSWAKELEFDGDPEHTLNYCFRVLGRRGVLQLNAVGAMEQLPMIRDKSSELLAAIEFNEGHRYSDYVPGTDQAATYGVAGLIAGATAAKLGLFKGLLVAILAAKKLLIVGAIALFAILAKVFGGKKVSSEAPPA